MSLTKSEAVTFASDVLGLGKLLDDSDRLKLLNEIIKAYHSIPFQNVDLLLLDEEDRGLPTWEQLKLSVMERRGGLCYTLAAFLKHLLDALGYETHFVMCTVAFPQKSPNHVAIIVQNLTGPRSIHFVDYSGHPTFEAVPIDFQEESPVYNHSYLEYKFVRKGSLLFRFHRRGETAPLMPGKEDVMIAGGWRGVIEIDMTPKDESDLNKPMHVPYTNPDATPFLTSFRAVVFQKDLKMIAIKNRSLLLEQSDHTLRETVLESKEDMMAAVQQHFPQLDSRDVEAALDKLKLYQ